jgi:hypothetical protein
LGLITIPWCYQAVQQTTRADVTSGFLAGVIYDAAKRKCI